MYLQVLFSFFFFQGSMMYVLPVLFLLGSFSPFHNSTAYYICPAGSYSSGGASSCTLCPAGTSSASSSMGMTSSQGCPSCPPGYYNSEPGGSNCYPCGQDKYSLGRATHCEDCPAGTYGQGSNMSSCVLAPIGLIFSFSLILCF